MNDNLPTYSQRTDAVLAGLHDALDPRSVDQAALVDWFQTTLDLAHLQRLAAMAERARRASWPS